MSPQCAAKLQTKAVKMQIIKLQNDIFYEKFL